MSGWRRCARIVDGVARTCVVAVAALHAAVGSELAQRYPVDVPAVVVPDHPAALARGRHLVEVVGQCTTCHGDDLGGLELADDPWLGRIWGPNLTPGRGGLSERSDLDLVRIIRHGVKPDGGPVAIMPSHYYNRFDDVDLGAILAYLRSLAPVDRVAPPMRIGLVSAAVVVSGRAPEILPAAWHDGCLYEGEEDLESRLAGLLRGGLPDRRRRGKLAGEMRRYDWSALIGTYDDLFAGLAGSPTAATH